MLSDLSRGRSARGIALIAVLWLIALLTILATTAVTLSVTQRRAAARDSEAIQADLTLDAAIRVALLRLINPQGKGPGWPVDQAQPLTLLDETVRVTVQREAGRVDLNTADPDLLFAVFAANGWRESDARSMTARIVDWRDVDEGAGKGGGEIRDYRAANLDYGPRNGPFQSVEELRQVLGAERIQSDLFDAFTVFTHAPGSAQDAARPSVKRALVWADGRRLGGHRWAYETGSVRTSEPGASAGPALGGEVLRLIACASARGIDRCRIAVVRLTGSAAKPFQVFEWRGLAAVSVR